MGEIVNLNRVRKSRAAAARRAQAAANRVRHGRDGLARMTDALHGARAQLALDSAKLGTERRDETP